MRDATSFVTHFCSTTTTFLSSLSLLLGNSCSLSAFYCVVHQPCNAETDTCLQPYNLFHFLRIGTWADAKIHKAFACRYFSDNIGTVVEEWTHGYFCLGYLAMAIFGQNQVWPLPSVAKTNVGQTKLGQYQVWSYQLGHVWPKPSLANRILAKSTIFAWPH